MTITAQGRLEAAGLMDAYRILGVSPTAPEAAIRAAYLTLMKRYHPDQPGADIERAKAIAAAYQQISEPGRRAEYDREWAEERLAVLGAPDAMAPPPTTRQTGRTSFFALSLVAAGLLAIVVSRPPSQPAKVEEPRSARVAPGAESAPSSLRRESRKEEEGVQVAPPPAPAPQVAEAAPQPGIIAPPAGEQREVRETRPQETAPVRVAKTERPEVAAVARPPQPPAQAPAATPQKIDLGALERHQTILFNQSYVAGDEGRRARLVETRAAFLKRLQDCSSDTCRRDAYLARNQEVAAIMSR